MTTFDPQNFVMTERQIACVTYLKQEFMLHGALPSVDRVAEVFGIPVATVKTWLASDEFKHVLTQEGMLAPRYDGVLTERQLAIANALLNFADKRSDREKCQEAGISVQQLAVWRKDSTFQSYMQQRAEQIFGDLEVDARMNIVRNVRAGDLNAAKFYFEMTGAYRPASKDGINIRVFVDTLTEILQARIQDPMLLEQIATDLDNLIHGRPVHLDQAASIPKAIEAAAVQVVPQPKQEPRLVSPNPSWDGKIDVAGQTIVLNLAEGE